MVLRSLMITALLFCCAAEAKRFRNAYISFELPPNWNCKLEGSEWVCENDFAGKTKEAIIILTAKEVGPTDTLAAYRAQLQTPRPIPGKGGAPAKSQVISVKERQIANQLWIDGMHLGSEVGSYFTRYLVTIKDRIAILVTFSAHKQHYSKYSRDFVNAVDSLRVVATKDTLGDRSAPSATGRPGQETIGVPVTQSLPLLGGDSPMPAEGSGSSGGMLNLLLLAVIAGAVGFYFYRRSSQKPKPKKSVKK